MLVKLQCMVPLGAKNTNINTKYETEKQAHINIMQIMMFAHWNSETLKHRCACVHYLQKEEHTCTDKQRGPQMQSARGPLSSVLYAPKRKSLRRSCA